MAGHHGGSVGKESVGAASEVEAREGFGDEKDSGNSGERDDAGCGGGDEITEQPGCR